MQPSTGGELFSRIAVLSYATVLNAIIPVYLTMLVGALARRFKILPPEADNGLMRLSVNLLFPCLIIERLVGNPEVMNPGRVVLAAALGFGLVGVGILVSHLAAPLIGLKKGEGRRTFAMTTGIQNYGYVAIPVMTALFPGKEILGVMFTFTLGVELAVWTLGVGILTGLSKAPWKAAINTPVISIVVSLLINFLGLSRFVPDILHTVMGNLGACSVPLSVVLIGASINDLIKEERFNWAVAIGCSVLRQGVIPIFFFLVAWLLPLTPDLKRVMVVQAAMPSAVFTIVVARHYGGHAPTAVQVVLGTTVASLLSAPLVIAFGMKWLGL